MTAMTEATEPQPAPEPEDDNTARIDLDEV